MAQIKFYRKSTAPSSPVVGGIWFNTADKTIQVYTAENTWEKYAGNLNNATWANNTLTITKHDGSSIALDFSDMASAAAMGKMLTAVGLNTDGTFKKNATNYGGSATTIGGEISAIDTKLKSVSDLVGATSVATQISDAKTELIGSINDGVGGNTIGGAKAFASSAASAAEDHANKYTDDALEALAGTVSSTAGEKVVVSVNQTNGKIESVSVSLSDIASASELAGVKTTAEAAQTADEVSTAITNAINALDATVSDEHDPNVKISVTETDGKLTGVTVTTADIASAATLKTVKDQVDAFFAGAEVSEVADKYKDTLKELQTYLTEDAAAAATMAGNIAANKTDIHTLATSTVNGHAIGSVVDDEVVAQTIVLNGSEIKLDGYAKGSESDLTVTDTINSALGKLEARVDAAAAKAADAADGVKSVNGLKGDVAIASGTANGTITVFKAGSLNRQDIAVTGLKSAAYTESSAYATAAQGAKADTAYQKPSTGIALGDMSDSIKTSLSRANSSISNITVVNESNVSIGAVEVSDPVDNIRTANIKLNIATVTELLSVAEEVLSGKPSVAQHETQLTDGETVIKYVNSVVDSSFAWAEF